MRCKNCGKKLTDLEKENSINDVLKYCGKCLDSFQGVL